MPKYTLNIRMEESLHGKILAEQDRLSEMTGIKPSLNEVTILLLERALVAKGKKK